MAFINCGLEFKSGDRAGQYTDLHLPIHFPLESSFKNSFTALPKCGGARPYCSHIHLHVARGILIYFPEHSNNPGFVKHSGWHVVQLGYYLIQEYLVLLRFADIEFFFTN
jgi:hypothetical protein